MLPALPVKSKNTHPLIDNEPKSTEWYEENFGMLEEDDNSLSEDSSEEDHSEDEAVEKAYHSRRASEISVSLLRTIVMTSFVVVFLI